MKYQKTFFAIGAWVAILPLLGFPETVKTILFAITGLCIVILSYTLRGARPPFTRREDFGTQRGENNPRTFSMPHVRVIRFNEDAKK